MPGQAGKDIDQIFRTFVGYAFCSKSEAFCRLSPRPAAIQGINPFPGITSGNQERALMILLIT